MEHNILIIHLHKIHLLYFKPTLLNCVVCYYISRHTSEIKKQSELTKKNYLQFLYETSPFPVVMAEIAIHGFKEVSDLSVCLKDIISRMMTHSVKVIGDFNRCIHNIEMPKLKYLLKFMKKYAR